MNILRNILAKKNVMLFYNLEYLGSHDGLL